MQSDQVIDALISKIRELEAKIEKLQKQIEKSSVEDALEEARKEILKRTEGMPLPPITIPTPAPPAYPPMRPWGEYPPYGPNIIWG